MVKSEIRKMYGAQRIALNDLAIADLQEKILNNIRSVNLAGINHLLSYYPIPERKEFDTEICEQLLKLENPLLRVYWPKIADDNITMDAYPVDTKNNLVRNRYNILEPPAGEPIDPQLIDAVFVPLIAFDNKGYRVGYGKGFYDRYLARCAQDVVKIGFSYFEALAAIDDINEFDVPLNYCITPMRVYEF